VEIYQNCNVYNDGAFDVVRDNKDNRILLQHGEPIRFGADGEKGVIQRSDGSVEIVESAKVGEENLLVHDEQRESPSLAFGLSRLAHGPTGPLPIGVFRDVDRPVYDSLMEEQLESARASRAPDLDALLHAGDTWQID
jgi:2-oxoglutarate ferredoxin oxidoreductase subunit beta